VIGEQPTPDLRESSGYRRSLLIGLTLSMLIAIGAEGCAFSRGDLGAPLDATRISDIKNGRTTEAQVVAMLGAPDRIQEINKRQVFHYYRYAMKHGTVPGLLTRQYRQRRPVCVL
jgi:hypothetical protein